MQNHHQENSNSLGSSRSGEAPWGGQSANQPTYKLCTRLLIVNLVGQGASSYAPPSPRGQFSVPATADPANFSLKVAIFGPGAPTCRGTAAIKSGEGVAQPSFSSNCLAGEEALGSGSIDLRIICRRSTTGARKANRRAANQPEGKAIDRHECAAAKTTAYGHGGGPSRGPTVRCTGIHCTAAARRRPETLTSHPRTTRFAKGGRQRHLEIMGFGGLP